MDFNPIQAQSFALNNTGDFLKKSNGKQAQKEAAQDFEAMFIQSTLKDMRPKAEGGLFNDGLAVDIFYQFMDEAIAKEIAHSENNFGLADQLIQQNFH
jgi:Rod binding domain-containing protein